MSLNNLVCAIEKGVVSNTTNKRIHELETRMTELEETISIERCKTVICLNETQIKAFYEQALKQGGTSADWHSNKRNYRV